MARRGRPRKQTLKSEIYRALTENALYCDFGFWMSEIYNVQENADFDVPPASEYERVLRQIEMGDYEIANCFISARQLVYLLAEKEGVIPKFSENIPDSEKIYSIYNACSYKGPVFDRMIEERAFLAACHKYGFSFPDDLNWSNNSEDFGFINSEWSGLRPEVLKKLSSNRDVCDGRVAAELSAIFERGGDPEEIEKVMDRSRCSFDSLLCLVSEKIISLLERYYKLPEAVRAENSEVARAARDLIVAHSNVSSNIVVQDYYDTVGDNVTLDNQVTIYVNYMYGYWDGEGYGYGGTYYIHSPATASFRPNTIKLMEKADLVSKKFKHVLVAAEKEAKEYRRTQKIEKVKKEKRMMRRFAKKLGFEIKKKPSEKVS